MKWIFSISLIVCLLIWIFYNLTGYKSAFEADRQCHFDVQVKYMDKVDLACDHDLETRQWILFQEVKEDSIAMVLERYRY